VEGLAKYPKWPDLYAVHREPCAPECAWSDRDLDLTVIGGPCWGATRCVATVKIDRLVSEPYCDYEEGDRDVAHEIYACEGHQLFYEQGAYIEKPAVVALAELADA